MVNDLRRRLVKICGLSSFVVLLMIFVLICVLSARQLDGAMDALDRITAEEDRGWYGDYRFFRNETETGYDKIFIDAEMNKEIFRMGLISAGVVLSLSWIVIVTATVFLSKRVVKPAAENYEKQKRFVSDANHELKTPLTLIMTNIDIVASETGENEWLSDARAAGERMSELINQLGILTKADEGCGPAKRETVDLTGLAKAKVREFRTMADKRGMKIVSDIEENSVCEGSGEATEKLAAILLDNAVRYGDCGSSIAVSLKNGRRPVLTVENKCRNAGEIEMDKVFDRFYRGDRSRTPGGGFGIGLSIAKAIVSEQGGDIKAYKKDRQTVVFTVAFA